MATIKVFVGYDSREDIAWQVCRQSLLRHASQPLDVYPIRQCAVRELGLYARPVDAASTEFSLTRFLTPYLAATEGLSLFVDCDFLFTRDLFEIVDELEPGKAVHVVKHDYIPRNAMKMDAQTQVSYPRKNWSSFMLFDGAHPDVRALTPEVVNTATPQHLHRFAWTDDASIGELSRSWNFLVGEFEPPKILPAAIHYTNGGPWFSNWRSVDYADAWCAERDAYEAMASGSATG
jgi:lipopolysaccharide biosynthesis glycosyltransferase